MARTTSTQTRSPAVKATPKVPGRKPSTVAKPTRAKREAAGTPVMKISVQERETLVAQAAYFRAEKRGFAPGNELQDWYEAEAEVLQLIGGGAQGGNRGGVASA